MDDFILSYLFFCFSFMYRQLDKMDLKMFMCVGKFICIHELLLRLVKENMCYLKEREHWDTMVPSILSNGP